MISSDVFGSTGQSLYLDDKKDKFLRIIELLLLLLFIVGSLHLPC